MVSDPDTLFHRRLVVRDTHPQKSLAICAKPGGTRKPNLRVLTLSGGIDVHDFIKKNANPERLGVVRWFVIGRRADLDRVLQLRRKIQSGSGDLLLPVFHGSRISRRGVLLQAFD